MRASNPSVVAKGTTVRVIPPRVRFVRRALGALGRVAPPLADRWAASIFCTPMPPASASAPPIVCGLEPDEFRVASGRFSLAAWGWGEGPTVLLAHGWSGGAGQMTRLASRLAMRGFRAVAFDMPAHGRSSGSTATLPDFARAIAAVADACGPVRAVVAHSLGATATAIALGDAIARGDGAPAERVVLLAPAADPLFFAGRAAAYLGLEGARASGMIDRIRERAGRDWSAFDVPTIARSIDVPALVLHDAADREVPFAQAQAIAAAWRGARLVRLDGLGHTRLLRDFDVVEAAVGFVGAASASAAGATSRRSA